MTFDRFEFQKFENLKRIPPNAECADGQEFKQNDIKRLFDTGFDIKHFQYNYTKGRFVDQ